jgi:hypothetical protein
MPKLLAERADRSYTAGSARFREGRALSPAGGGTGRGVCFPQGGPGSLVSVGRRVGVPVTNKWEGLSSLTLRVLFTPT